MLNSLHVRNYVLIDSLDVDFPEGLIIITGQTGAGKSILLGALSLLMGAKSDASVISEGSDSCVVEAEFSTDDEAVKQILEDNDVEWESGNLVIRRVVHQSGRSRSFINDCPVQVGVLASISGKLIDIHSQHQSLLLSDHQFQLSILDHYAGNTELLARSSEAWKEMLALKAESAQLAERIAKIAADKDYNEAQFRQLEAAKLQSGELETLEEEQKQLANAEEIKECLYAVEQLNLGAALKDASRMLSKAGKYVPAIAALEERFEASRIEVDDILGDAESINERLDVSADRLQAVEDRMSLIYELLKKHSCTDVDELIALKDSLGAALFDSEALVERKAELDEALAAAKKRCDELADALHASRVNSSASFAKSIEDSIHFLELDKAVFEVNVNDAAQSASGRDAIAFTFSSTGRNPVDVAKCASGGEISRIMLCLKAMMARFTNMPTMIFDEIDTGVSGSVADKMGSMICSMGADMQVFAITHLPQVAAKGNAHYMVEKGEDAGKISSTIKRLSPEERVSEIARMLSGSSISDAAIANAKALLAD